MWSDLETRYDRTVNCFWRVSERKLRAGDCDSNRVRTTVSDPFHHLVAGGVPETVFAFAHSQSREVIAEAVCRDCLEQRGAIVNIDADRTIGAIGVPGPAFDRRTVGNIVVTVIPGSRRPTRGAGGARCKAPRVATQFRRKWRAAPHICGGVAINQFVRASAGLLEWVLFRKVQTIVLNQNPGGFIRFEIIQPFLPRRQDQGRARRISVPDTLHHAGYSRLQVISKIETIEDTRRLTRLRMPIYVINAAVAGAEAGEQFAAAFRGHGQPSFDPQFLHDYPTAVSHSQNGQYNPDDILEHGRFRNLLHRPVQPFIKSQS